MEGKVEEFKYLHINIAEIQKTTKNTEYHNSCKSESVEITLFMHSIKVQNKLTIISRVCWFVN